MSVQRFNKKTKVNFAFGVGIVFFKLTGVYLSQPLPLH